MSYFARMLGAQSGEAFAVERLAEEIASLRAKNERLRVSAAARLRAAIDMRAEAERLREALINILLFPDYGVGKGMTAQEIARAALAGDILGSPENANTNSD